MTQRPQNAFSTYHAHVYFDEGTVEQARRLCQEAAAQFGVTMGRVHEKPVGPHPRWSCQLTFDAGHFDGLVPWLDAHRAGLNILVHPRTGNSLEDHTRYASWLGEAVELNLSALKSVSDSASRGGAGAPVSGDATPGDAQSGRHLCSRIFERISRRPRVEGRSRGPGFRGCDPR